MTLKTIINVVLAGVALSVGAQAAGAGPTPDAMREDGFDRAVAAAKLQQWMAENGFERAVAAKLALQSPPRMSPDTLDAINSRYVSFPRPVADEPYRGNQTDRTTGGWESAVSGARGS